MDFITNFEKICKERGVSPSRALIDAGLSNSLYTKWRKSPKAVPNLDTLILLSKYFNTTIDDIVGYKTEQYVTDFKNYPGLYQIAQHWHELTQAQRDEIINYAKYVSKGVID